MEYSEMRERINMFTIFVFEGLGYLFDDDRLNEERVVVPIVQYKLNHFLYLWAIGSTSRRSGLTKFDDD